MVRWGGARRAFRAGAKESELYEVTRRRTPGSDGLAQQDRAEEEDVDFAGVAWRRTPGSDGLAEEDSGDLGGRGWGAVALGPATGQPPCSSAWLVQVLALSTRPFSMVKDRQRPPTAPAEEAALRWLRPAGADHSCAWSGRCSSPAGRRV